MTALETLRPNGKVYRRRKPLEATTLTWNEWATVVMVYGTHDPDLAREIAQEEWNRECEGDLPVPIREWIKVVPWDALGMGYDRTVMQVDGNMRNSTPALRYGDDDA